VSEKKVFCRQRLKEIIQNFNNYKVLVIGDFALDEMIYGASYRISREAPVLILKHTKTDSLLGAASNAANNIAKLNKGKVGAIGVIGNDYHGKALKETLEKAEIDTSALIIDESRVTTTKTRISGSSAQSVTQQIIRIDRETKEPISSEIEKEIIRKIHNLIPQYDGVLLSDYSIGVMTKNIIEEAITTANVHEKFVAVDSQDKLYRFKGAEIITPNQPDAEKTLGYQIKNKEILLKAGKELLDMTFSKKVLMTRGSEGMMLFERDGSVVNIPAFNRTEVFDVTGAGDTVVACVLLGICSGAQGVEASILGNLAASLVVRKFGAASTNAEELLENLEKINFDNIEKIQLNPC
jgi:rfaE bifunctional protein kinase chain/domain